MLSKTHSNPQRVKPTKKVNPKKPVLLQSLPTVKGKASNWTNPTTTLNSLYNLRSIKPTNLLCLMKILCKHFNNNGRVIVHLKKKVSREVKPLNTGFKVYRCQMNVFRKAWLFKEYWMFRSNLSTWNQGAQVINCHPNWICQMNKMNKMKGFLPTVCNLIYNKVHTLVKKIQSLIAAPKAMLVSKLSRHLKVQYWLFHKSFRCLINPLATNLSRVHKLMNNHLRRNHRGCRCWSNLRRV